ncbi:RIP metalloprotease RseP [Legionella sp. CNM-4043-24]|uniref:RIP metalloprotease RseP n=1 Tax=Legionella sp. CNM-4043-24 TaxID=3421646 RepID=UPI00403A9C02
MLLTMVYFIIALLVLVLIHEYGHFIVARLCGVRVLRFSFGFGKVLARWTDRRGTEFVWSLVPLGGYVKMLDESEEEVPEGERHLAFNNKPLLSRIAIVIAGPMFNFLFAFAALWLVLVMGIYSLAPMIDGVAEGSPAAMAGLQPSQEIISLNNKPIRSWRDFQYAMMPWAGSDQSLTLRVKSMKNGKEKTVILPLSSWTLDPKKPDVLTSLGIRPFIPTVPPIIGGFLPDAPAMKAGLKTLDRIESVNGKTVTDWMDLVDFVRPRPDTPLSLTVLRDGQHLTLTLLTGTKVQDGQKTGYLGLMPQKVDWPKTWLRYEHENPLRAITTAFRQTVELTGATFALLGRFVSGKLALENISGPVGIAQGAGDSGRSGLSSYLSFLALVSISLGVLNLLPIPMLDGGHLLFYLIEFVRRKPLSDTAKSMGLYLGLGFLVALMVLAFSNDLSRLMS